MEQTTGGCSWRRAKIAIALVVRQCFCACVDVNCLSSARRGFAACAIPDAAAQGATVEPLAVNIH